MLSHHLVTLLDYFVFAHGPIRFLLLNDELIRVFEVVVREVLDCILAY